MTYLLLSILASTAILIIFRLIDETQANTRHTILVSYLVSAVTGVVIFTSQLSTLSASWFLPAAAEGIAFYIIFRAMARTAQTNGIAVAGIAAKMSVIIPILFGLLWLEEKSNWLTVSGIILGLTAVLLSSGSNLKMGQWEWPLFVFLGTGLIDASFKLCQTLGLSDDEFPGFVTTIFTFAFIASLIHHLLGNDRNINTTSSMSGVALGLANFGTVYFILKALATPNWDSSIIYPLNNFGIVTLSTVIAILVFKEKLRPGGWAGLMLAGLAIVFLYAGSIYPVSQI